MTLARLTETIGHVADRVERAEAVQELATFTCGGTTPHEVEVDELVHDLHTGSLIEVRLAERAGEIAGLCMVHPRELGMFQDAAYIAVIAVAEDFRGQRVGDFLLADALKVVSNARAGVMPLVWALIDPANSHSHRLFERHSFADVVPANTAGVNEGPYDIRLRVPGVPV